MRSVVGRIVAVGLLAASCSNAPVPPGPVEQNGVLVYGDWPSGKPIVCDARPIQLDGNRTDLRLTGFCRYVRVAGAHNDIAVELAPGGTIEITGEHNDVTWRQMQPGLPPSLIDSGQSNTFHPGRV